MRFLGEIKTKSAYWKLNLPQDPRSQDPNVLRTLLDLAWFWLALCSDQYLIKCSIKVAPLLVVSPV